MDILLVYVFCTFGGVERVILNRAWAFRKFGLDVHISVGYLQDRGALSSFRVYLRTHDLERRVFPFILPKNLKIDWQKYTAVFIVDTPQVLAASADAKKVYVECHTPYKNARQYLFDLPSHVKKVIVPSHSFGALIQQEFEHLPPIHVLPNFLTGDFFNPAMPDMPTVFPLRPLVYFARVEDLKNFIEAARLFESLVERSDLMYWIIGENATADHILQSLERKRLLARSFLRPHVAFEQVPYLVRLIKAHRGIFFSPSKGESFGMSAAECMGGGVPVLLSDIPPHRELVENDSRFLYPLGDLMTACQRLSWLLDHWDEASERVYSFSKKFTASRFIEAWQTLWRDEHAA